MHESETARLQREVDGFTRKLENEKRKLMILQDQIKQVNSEIQAKEKSIDKLKPDRPIDDVRDKIVIKRQANSIKQETLKLN